MIYEIELRGATHRIELTRSADAWSCRVDGRDVPLDAVLTADGALSLLLNGRSYEVHSEPTPDAREVQLLGERFTVTVRDPRALRGRRSAADDAAGPKKITAPMPGKVVRIIAPEGTEVQSGASVLVIEAMKMQNELKAPKSGVVKKITAAEGAAVNAGDTLAVIE